MEYFYDGPAELILGSVPVHVHARLTWVSKGPAWEGELTDEDNTGDLWDAYQNSADAVLKVADGPPCRVLATKYRVDNGAITAWGTTFPLAEAPHQPGEPSA
ncbi:hypothetical protein OHV05_36070 (plasmid) [Kitasatospora sp. NBC_00070]|uniref:hypothetical protein n=1 Tax=Kitasatospora sp. NBC_00070 TaxID=2975962 RepID=UPI002F917620